MKIKKILVISVLSLVLVGNSVPFTLATEPVLNEIHKVTAACKDESGIKSWTTGNMQISQYSNMVFTGELKKEFTIFEEAYYLKYYIKNSGDMTFDWRIFDPYDSEWARGKLAPGESETWTAYCHSKDMPGGTYRLSVYTTNGGPDEYDFTADIHD